MAYRVEIKKSALKEMQSLPRKVQRRIDQTISSLALDPRPHGTEKLKGLERTYRIRVGDYRVVYWVEDAILLVLIVRVAHRSNVYRGI